MWSWLIATVAAWQAFTVGPFRTSKSGHTRAFWAADVAEPTWVANTFAGFAFAGFDGTALAGDVDLWAAEGLDPMKCVPEVIWDSRANHGARIDHPPRLEQGAGHGWHAIWHFETDVKDAPAVVSATAFVFCPIDREHEKPPWGATFTSTEAVIAGPKAKQAYCAKLGGSKQDIGTSSLTGKRTMELAFACGVLVRQRGRDLVDDCTGDVLLALDTLGPKTTAYASKTGTPLQDEELRRYLGGSGECARITLALFDPSTDRVWQAALKKLGKRVLFAFSRDGMIQP
jgi:hypothetical protein